jgi:hypothetical protein
MVIWHLFSSMILNNVFSVSLAQNAFSCSGCVGGGPMQLKNSNTIYLVYNMETVNIEETCIVHAVCCNPDH